MDYSCLRYGRWEDILGQSPPPRDARGVTTYGGPQFASVVFHVGRVLALAAKAQLASQQLLEVDDMTAFDLARKSLWVAAMSLALPRGVAELYCSQVCMCSCKAAFARQGFRVENPLPDMTLPSRCCACCCGQLTLWLPAKVDSWAWAASAIAPPTATAAFGDAAAIHHVAGGAPADTTLCV